MKKIKFLKYIFILCVFVLFILLINRFVIKEGNITQIEQAQNTLLEAEMRDKSITQMSKDLGIELDILYNTILETQNKADELHRQSDMAKERNQKDWIKFSNELKSQEMYLRTTLDGLMNKYIIDKQKFIESRGNAIVAHSDFLVIQKELYNVII